MKGLLIGLAILAAAGTSIAQEGDEVIPSGVPALLEAPNGKKVRVFLQEMRGSNLVFRALKSTKDVTVPAHKIPSLEFFPKYDAKTIHGYFNRADYEAVAGALGYDMSTYWDYMVISNNLRDDFIMLMEAYREDGKLEQSRRAAELLTHVSDERVAEKANVNLALIALAENNVDKAKAIQSELKSEAAKLYLQVCIERALKEPKKAIQTAAQVVEKFGNNMDWLPPTELLSARLYLDMGMTNSAAMTARQVGSLYAGTHIAGDAEKFGSGLVITTDETNEMEGKKDE